MNKGGLENFLNHITKGLKVLSFLLHIDAVGYLTTNRKRYHKKQAIEHLKPQLVQYKALVPQSGTVERLCLKLPSVSFVV